MQIDRLFQIVQILLGREKVTAKALAERFQVSTRTIYRDIDTLSLNGVPVYATKGKGGGIHLMDSYKMDQSVLSDEEKNSLLLGLETLKATQAEDVEEVLSRFRELFRHDHDNWIRVDFSHWGNDPKEKKKFEIIKKALTTYNAISFDYYGAYGGNHSFRTVYPLQLVFKEKAWYVIAYCKAKKDLRFFKVIRMSEVLLEEERFNPKEYPIERDLLKNSPPIKSTEYKFWLSKEVRYRIYDDFYRENINVLPDGNYEVTYYGYTDEWLFSFVLSYGPYLKVIEPKEFREAVKNRIQQMSNNYI